MKVYCLYEIETLKIRYIGITTKDLRKRLYQHFYHKNKNKYKDNWIKKVDNKVGIRLLKTLKNKEEARNLELYLIRKYKNSHKLVNLSDRGFCDDKIKLSKEKCEQISKTLKEKYSKGELKISGEKQVYVWDKNGIFVRKFNNGKECSEVLKIPYSKIGTICNKGGYYKDYTFSRTSELPIQNYIKCYDFLKQELKLCFKKEDIPILLGINKFHNININKNKFYLKRYNVRTDNNFPPFNSGNIICNGKIYSCIENVMYSSEKILHTWRKDIKFHLDNNLIFKKDNIEIKNEMCAWYKFGELLETPEGFKTKEEVETLYLNV